jgi:hypothetical protein
MEHGSPPIYPSIPPLFMDTNHLLSVHLSLSLSLTSLFPLSLSPNKSLFRFWIISSVSSCLFRAIRCNVSCMHVYMCVCVCVCKCVCERESSRVRVTSSARRAAISSSFATIAPRTSRKETKTTFEMEDRGARL